MYQREAQGLASLGRGPDTELVHMTPREVNALDSLARQNGLGGLPTNPQTGLPEAGIFDSILPILIGAGAAAAAPFTAGTSLGFLTPLLSSPLLMGSTAALGAGIASGFDLSEMAKYGLGVAGGASLASSLAGAGAGTTAGQAAAAEAATPQALQEIAKQQGLQTASTVTNPLNVMPAKVGTVPGAGKFFNVPAGTANLDNIGRAFSREGAKQLFGSGIGDARVAGTLGKAPIAAIGGSLAADQYSKINEVPDFPEPKKSNFIYPEGGFMSPPRRSIDPFGFAPATAETSEERLFFDPSAFTSPGYIPAKEGGLLKGPGDGMSDEILLPITGAKNTIAAVSPDEFIVPADVVSGLGNGSSSAGAKQLYAMMDRVRDSRTGKTSQPREIKAKGMMPA